MREFFQANLDILFFLYGLVFVIMGLAIIIQQRQGSLFKIGNVLWLLGAFAIAHGLNEWLDMWAIIKKNQQEIFWLELLGWFTRIVSYYFFFEFGRRLLRVSAKNKKGISFFLKPWSGMMLAALAAGLGLSHKNFWYSSSIWMRYLLGFPAGLLTGLGMIVYYRSELKEKMPGLRKDFYYPAVFLFLYGLLSSLVVPPADFPPASLINTDTFLKFSGGIPVQAFRTICAVFSSIYVFRILIMFKWEAVKNLCRVETERLTDKVTSIVEEMIMLIDKDLRIKWANTKLKSLYGKDILNNFCYKVTHHIDEPCCAPNDICPIAEIKKTNKPATVIHKHFDSAGNPLYVELSVYPMLDERGRPTGDYVHASRDITQRIKEQKELEAAYIELKAIQEKLLAAEKMASLGKLSAGIAHEINNPIGFVVSNLSTLDKYISQLLILLNVYYEIEAAIFKAGSQETEKLYQRIKDFKKTIDFEYLAADMPKLINETLDGAQRIVRIVRDLKSFARKDEIEFTEANINELAESALNIVWNEVKYKADVVKEYGELPPVSCHPQQITQALMNIIVNGAQSIEKSGKITIRTYLKEDKAFIEISDSGGGMSEETQKRLFEPFFTTKKVGEGTGLGLAIVYGIIQNHKGNIEVESKPGQGSTFIISLPIKAEKQTKPANQ